MDSSSLNIDICKFLHPDAAKTSIEKISAPVFMKMLVEGLHTDITLIAEGGPVMAHRSVLATCSPVFEAMFRHPMRENLTSTVDLSGSMRIEPLQLFLLLLYSSKGRGRMPVFDGALDEHFEDVFEACCIYQVGSRLAGVLHSALDRNLTPENCWYYHRRTADSPEDEKIRSDLQGVCRRYVEENYGDVIRSESVLVEMKQDPELVLDVLRTSYIKQEIDVSQASVVREDDLEGALGTERTRNSGRKRRNAATVHGL